MQPGWGGHPDTPASDWFSKITVRHCTVDSDIVVLTLRSALVSERSPATFQLTHFIHAGLCPSKFIALTLFHSLMGCDTTSQFLGCGKKTAWAVWNSFPGLTNTLVLLTLNPNMFGIESIHMQQIERFVVLMYSKGCGAAGVNDARLRLFTSGTKSLESIPPTQAALFQHVKRAILQSSYSSTCHGRSLGWTATCFGRPLLRCTNYFAMLKYLHQTATCLTRPADSRMLAFIPAKAATAMAHFKSEQVSGPDHNTLVLLGDVEWNDFVVWTMPSTRQLSTTMTGRLPWSQGEWRCAWWSGLCWRRVQRGRRGATCPSYTFCTWCHEFCESLVELRSSSERCDNLCMQLVRSSPSWRCPASSRLPVQGKPPCSSFSSASWLGVSYSQACIQHTVQRMCVFKCTLWINDVVFSHIFSIVRFISHCIQYCNWTLCFIMLCICYKMYTVWCICLIWHNSAYVHSLSRGATCHGRPPLLRTSGGRRWQVLLYYWHQALSAQKEIPDFSE